MRGGKLLLLLIFSIMTVSTPIMTRERGPADVSGMISITVAVRAEPPAWAIMQRRLIHAMNDAAPHKTILIDDSISLPHPRPLS